MKIACPVAEGMLSMHFGHCREFKIYTIEDNKVTGSETIDPPAHEPGVLPQFLAEKGVNAIIAGGMGARAQKIFEQQDIHVATGASGNPDDLVNDYLKGNLTTGQNLCDH